MSVQPAIRKCEWCGAEFTPKHPLHIYCTRECYKRGNARKVSEMRAERKTRERGGMRVCEVCGAEFAPRRYASTCSMKCRRELELRRVEARGHRMERKPADRVCRLCGKPFTPGHANQRYCSTECSTAFRTMNYRATVMCRSSGGRRGAPTVRRTCQYCGAEFMAYSSRSRFCSPECREQAANLRSDRKREASVAKCPVCGTEFHKYSVRNIFCSRQCAQIAVYNRERYAASGGAGGKNYMTAEAFVCARKANAAHDRTAKVRISRAFMVSDDKAVASGARDERLASECAHIAAMEEEDEG